MIKINLIFLALIFLGSCQELEKKYICDSINCIESEEGIYMSLDECMQDCNTPTLDNTIITVFIYENCPIAQYMCGPLRESYKYFCDTLNQNMTFRGFSPNSFSTDKSLSNFMLQYDIPFPIIHDYDEISQEPGLHTQYYLPSVTPEVFIEHNGSLVYRGMIDNSYQSLGQWTNPSENYLMDILNEIVAGAEITYTETQAVGCLINY
ncbi:MAG: hypothetical protein CBD51_006100 [Flavobacteriales bacterium TMED191]|nr:MAG: hypothetical protein CBD51_006100 [Flavobacteriales bacterium TMED191]